MVLWCIMDYVVEDCGWLVMDIVDYGDRVG